MPFTQLIETTIKCIQELCLPNSDLMFYHDGMAGWKSVPKEIRGFSINRVDDLRCLISEQIYFRDPERYSDNYNVIDNTGLWMITFCHEDDWFCFHRSDEMVDRLKGKNGYRADAHADFTSGASPSEHAVVPKPSGSR